MKPSDYLSKEEIRYFTERSDFAGARTVLFNWAFIAAIFAMVVSWTLSLIHI